VLVLKKVGGVARIGGAGASPVGRGAAAELGWDPVHFRLARLDTDRGSVLNSVPVSSVLEGVYPPLIIGREVDMGRGGDQEAHGGNIRRGMEEAGASSFGKQQQRDFKGIGYTRESGYDEGGGKTSGT
jgi:hypothetical protein